MLEINHVNLPASPRECTSPHAGGLSASLCLLLIAARGTWGEMGGCCTSQGVTPRTSGTNGVLLNNPKATQLTLA